MRQREALGKGGKGQMGEVHSSKFVTFVCSKQMCVTFEGSGTALGNLLLRLNRVDAARTEIVFYEFAGASI